MNLSFQMILIDQVKESPLNNRKIYNEQKMKELTESIREKGVLTPLIVRPNDGAFEIAAGSRRYRAAAAAGLKELPVIVREMTDTELLEVITIENLQREDVHPLEEAEGYRSLMDRGGYDVAAIAGKVGKSESYVYQRLKLSELIPEAKKLFLKDQITAGHAILIARQQQNEQQEILKDGLYDFNDKDPVSVRELAEYINTQIHLDLNSASFSKKDPDLLPSAGPCTTCPKRTGFVPALFPDIKKKDTCTDPECFHTKQQAFIDIWIQKHSEDTDSLPLRLSAQWDNRQKKLDPDKPIPPHLYHQIRDRKKESCQYVREGIIVDGREKGKVLSVCIEPGCKTHASRYSNDPDDRKYKAQQKAAAEKQKREIIVRTRVLNEILKRLPEGEPSVEDLQFIAGQLYDELWHEFRKQLLSRHDIKPIKVQYGFDWQKPLINYVKTLSSRQIYYLLMEMALISNTPKPWQGKTDHLLQTATRYKVDVKKIEAQFQAEWKEKDKAKAKKKAGKEKKQAKDAKAKKPGKKTVKGFAGGVKLRELIEGKLEKPQSGVCRVCGCTEENACEGGCAWADKSKTICTACVDDRCESCEFVVIESDPEFKTAKLIPDQGKDIRCASPDGPCAVTDEEKVQTSAKPKKTKKSK